jgi:hypothetical protein
MAATIDLMTLSPSGDVLNLVMTELGPWDGSSDRLLRIQTRLNDYLSFALDGDLGRRFPELAGKKVHVRIDCDCVADAVSSAFLDRLRDVAERHGISLSVEVLGQPGEA